jgi:hypothetical protein
MFPPFMIAHLHYTTTMYFRDTIIIRLCIAVKVDCKSEETAKTACAEKFSICKSTGHFWVQLLGVVVECPRVEMPKLELISKFIHHGASLIL